MQLHLQGMDCIPTRFSGKLDELLQSAVQVLPFFLPLPSLAHF